MLSKTSYVIWDTVVPDPLTNTYLKLHWAYELVEIPCHYSLYQMSLSNVSMCNNEKSYAKDGTVPSCSFCMFAFLNTYS